MKNMVEGRKRNEEEEEGTYVKRVLKKWEGEEAVELSLVRMKTTISSGKSSKKS